MAIYLYTAPPNQRGSITQQLYPICSQKVQVIPDPQKVGRTHRELEVLFNLVMYGYDQRANDYVFTCADPYYGSMADALTLCEKRYPQVTRL